MFVTQLLPLLVLVTPAPQPLTPLDPDQFVSMIENMAAAAHRRNADLGNQVSVIQDRI